MGFPRKQPVPRGLSSWARGVWRELTAECEFERHELVTFERALRWFDASDALFASAQDAKEPKEQRDLLKQSMDASNTALRHWRALKWPTPAGARRPGRPSGAEWSPARKAAVNA